MFSGENWKIEYYNGSSWANITAISSSTQPSERSLLDWTWQGQTSIADSYGEKVPTDTQGIYYYFYCELFAKRQTSNALSNEEKYIIDLENQRVSPNSTNPFFRLYPDTDNYSSDYFEVHIVQCSPQRNTKATYRRVFLEMVTKDKYTSISTTDRSLS